MEFPATNFHVQYQDLLSKVFELLIISQRNFWNFSQYLVNPHVGKWYFGICKGVTTENLPRNFGTNITKIHDTYFFLEFYVNPGIVGGSTKIFGDVVSKKKFSIVPRDRRGSFAVFNKVLVCEKILWNKKGVIFQGNFSSQLIKGKT